MRKVASGKFLQFVRVRVCVTIMFLCIRGCFAMFDNLSVTRILVFVVDCGQPENALRIFINPACLLIQVCMPNGGSHQIRPLGKFC